MGPLRRLAAALFLLALSPVPGRAAAPQGVADPVPDWPPDMPVDEILSSWESFKGAYTVDQQRVSYQLYVDPARIGIYRVTRYTVSPAPGATGDEALSLETVQFIAYPGREVPRCYQRRVDAAVPRPWLVLERGSQPYKVEMMRGIEMYVRHRATTR
jgi:hypothetical protein